MLLWFVDKKVAELALKQAVSIEEEHVECRPERITDAVVDENVDIHLIRKYFTYDAWLLVEQVLKRKQKRMIGSAKFAIKICKPRRQGLLLYSNRVCSGSILPVLVYQSSQRQRTGFAVHVMQPRSDPKIHLSCNTHSISNNT